MALEVFLVFLFFAGLNFRSEQIFRRGPEKKSVSDARKLNFKSADHFIDSFYFLFSPRANCKPQKLKDIQDRVERMLQKLSSSRVGVVGQLPVHMCKAKACELHICLHNCNCVSECTFMF